MNNTNDIHHWRLPWSAYRNLARVGFEHTTTEFCPDALTNWAIRPRVKLAHRDNLLQLLQLHPLFSAKFRFIYCLRQSPRFLWLTFSCGNGMSLEEWTIHIVFSTEGLFEVAITSWHEWELKLRQLKSVQTL